MTATDTLLPTTVAQPIARGQNLIVVAPPAPAWAAPVLAALQARQEADGLLLVLAPTPSLGEWHTVVDGLGGAGQPTLVARGTTAERDRVRALAGSATLITTPEGAMDLLGASALDAGRVQGVLIAWPETWTDRDLLSAILQDVPREAQRIIVTAHPSAVADLVERHAWRAMTAGPTDATAAAGPVHTLAVSWERRTAVLPEIVSALDAASVAVWTADASHHQDIRRALAGTGASVEVTLGPPDPAALVIVFDPPPAALLPDLLAAGKVTLLMPPGTEGHVGRIASPRQPLILPGDPAALAGETAKRRRTIARTVEGSTLEAGLLALGPLFERFEPTAVAAALYELWRGEATTPPQAAPVAAATVARVWVNTGRRDEVGAGDLVGLLTNELRVDRTRIGRIDLRETFSLVELPADEAARVATALTGKTLRRRRLIARVDAADTGGARGGGRRGAR